MSASRYALVDGNNFYASCERIFRPTLQGRPLIVLSNNDGCAIARSNEAKALGVKMGAPWHMIRHLEQEAGLVALSANFTLYGDMRKGRRPSFDAAAAPDRARAVYEELVRELRATNVPVATGEFQAMMQVELVNDGPVTILIDSKKQF